MYDILTECHLTNEMNTAKEQDPKSMINARSIEVYVPFFLKTMTFTHEEVEYTTTLLLKADGTYELTYYFAV
jgi:hypothetical protein